MKRSINTKGMKELDRLLINKKYDSSYELLRYAGFQCYKSLIKHISEKDSIVILCGANNNGGDGLVVFEHLFKNHYQCIAFVDKTINSEENKLQQDHLKTLNYPTSNLRENIKYVVEVIQKADVIVDALVGIGCSRDMDIEMSQIIIEINKSKAKVISIDVASGLLSDSGFMVNQCVVADSTLVIGAYKHGHLLFDGRDVSGRLEFVDINSELANDAVQCFEANEIPLLVHPRKNNVHKYDFKHVCVLGGSPSMMGSVALSASAALAAGAGLVSLATHLSNSSTMRSLPYEIITPFYETMDDLINILSNKDVVVYGMGVSKEKPTLDVLAYLLSLDIPIIVDGDGLFHLSKHTGSHSNTALILTPHLKELSILANVDMQEVRKDVVTYVKEVANKYQATVICKGPTTIVCHKNQVNFYQVGNSGLATAGTGDVFAGLLASQVAQHANITQAIQTTLAIYDRAAHFAMQKYGVVAMIASNVIEMISSVIKQASYSD